MRHAFWLAGLLGVWMPALAQDPVQDPQADPTAAVEETVVVTATLEREKESKVPAAVTVITAEEIEARQASYVLDLLATTPGATVAQSGAPGSVTSLFLRGSDSNQTLALWNGIPLNSPYDGAFNWAYLPTDGAERVEVVRGPFSALYGSQAMGGVVQVLSRPKDGGRLRLEGGEDGYGRAGLSAGYGTGKVRFEVFGNARQGGGRFANDSFDGEDLAGRVELKPLEGLRIGLLARFQDSTVGIPFSGITPRLRREQDDESTQIALPVTFERGGFRLEGLLSRTDSELEFRDPDDSSFTFSNTETAEDRARLVATFRAPSRFWVSVGGDWSDQEVSDRSNFGVNLTDATRENRAAFSQLHADLGSVQIDLGVRYDDDELFGSEVSPKAGLVWSATPALSLRASYGEGFRSPSFLELFFPFSGNPALQPETSESYEVGADWTASRFRAGLSAFQNEQRDLIDFDLVTFTNINIDRARSRGVEAEGAWRFAAGTLHANVTWLDTEDLDTGLPLLRRPEWSGNLIATARHAAFSGSLVGRYVGERDDVDPVTFGRVVNPSYVRFDLAGQWQALPWLSPYARVENLADEEYSSVLGFPSPERTLIGGVALSF